MSIICTYKLLVWKWIDEKFDIKWVYLLYFIFVDTAFLLCMVVVILVSSLYNNNIPLYGALQKQAFGISVDSDYAL